MLNKTELEELADDICWYSNRTHVAATIENLMRMDESVVEALLQMISDFRENS